MPLVSVITPTYNSSKYIRETAEAILGQTLQDFEWIIVDDCSTDNTIDILKAYNDPRIKIFQNEKNRGIPYTHNRLIELTTTNYIAIQDHDDISYPYRLETQYRFLKDNPGYIATASYADYIDSEGKPTSHRFLKKILRVLKLNLTNINGPEIPASLLFKNNFCHSTIMINKQKLGDIRYDPELSICDDYGLLVKMAGRHPIFIGSKPVLKYRMHKSNTSSQRFAELQRDFNAIQGKYLKKLQVNATPEQLFIHNGYRNFMKNFVPGTGYLENSIAWYRTLIQKNAENRVFEEKHLRKAIELDWYERCLACRKAGLRVVKSYYSNHFDNRARTGKLPKSIILALSILFMRNDQ